MLSQRTWRPENDATHSLQISLAPGDCRPIICSLLSFLPSSLLSSSSSCFFPLLPVSLSFTVLNNQTPLQLILFTSLSAQYEQASSLGDVLLVVLKGEWSWICVLWDWRAKTCYEIFHLEIYSDFFFFFLIRRLQNIWSATLLEMESSRSLFLLSLNREHVLIIIKSEVFNWRGGGGGWI